MGNNGNSQFHVLLRRPVHGAASGYQCDLSISVRGLPLPHPLHFASLEGFRQTSGEGAVRHCPQETGENAGHAACLTMPVSAFLRSCRSLPQRRGRLPCCCQTRETDSFFLSLHSLAQYKLATRRGRWVRKAGEGVKWKGQPGITSHFSFRSSTIWMALVGHSSAQMPQPLQ